MAVISMKALLETGVHFGHRTRKWNPKMKPFIFTERNGIHIIDLQQTLNSLESAFALVRDAVANGGMLLFVGTKRQAQEAIGAEAERCGAPHVNQRWLGGMLTNWRTMRERIMELKKLEERRDKGEFELITKKEGLVLTRKIAKLEERLGGIREMARLPELIFVVDVRREHTAIHEANILNIPVIAMVDTNCDPGGVDYVIPANDDAIRAIKLVAGAMADAVLEGKAIRKDAEPAEGAPEAEAAREAGYAETDEELLGAATLAKLRGGELFPEEKVSVEKLAAAEVLAETPLTTVADDKVTEEIEEVANPDGEGVEAEA
ncbi:MAG: 30S ribosomal protein S2 [Chloroflexi bacterium]|nr:30S ribosomal protein S2 [Chloroflexota bacterium]